MKKWLFSYLIFNFLAFSLPGSYVISIFKIGGLISHFHDHKHDGPETGFLSFLAAHYFEKKHHEADHGAHEKLPFHDHHGEGVNFASQSPSLQPEYLTIPDFSKLMIQSDIVIAAFTPIHASAYLGDIWQPPKA